MGIEDLRFADLLVKGVLTGGEIDGDITIGSDQWIRDHFCLYTLHVLRTANLKGKVFF